VFHLPLMFFFLSFLYKNVFSRYFHKFEVKHFQDILSSNINGISYLVIAQVFFYFNCFINLKQVCWHRLKRRGFQPVAIYSTDFLKPIVSSKCSFGYRKGSAMHDFRKGSRCCFWEMEKKKTKKISRKLRFR